MNKIYINLDTAEERREKFKDTNIRRWRATPREEVPTSVETKMLSMTSCPKQTHLGKCGCWLSHTKLLEEIVKHKMNDVLILEDDAVQVNDIPSDYPRDGIVYVGGMIWWRKMVNDKNPKLQHKQGMNLCPPEYRVLGNLSYIIPNWEIAETILKLIYSQKRYRAIDTMMGNIGMKQYYNYPASFREEGVLSQISENNKQNKIMTETYEYINYKKYLKQKKMS